VTEEIDFIARFEEFLKSYKTEEGDSPYHDAIGRLSLENLISVSIDFNHLLTFDPDLAEATKEDPKRAIEAASAAIRRILRIVDPDYSETIENLHARFKEVPDRVSVRFIRSEHIGQLIMVDALVTRVSDVKPLLVEGVFQCRQCQEIIYIPQANQFMAPPLCTNDACRSKGPFELIPERSKFVDWQKIRLQEKPEELPPGALPRALDCILQEDLVDIARPGDPCRVVGILRSTQDVTARSRRKAPTFSVFLATNYVAVSEREADRVEITPKEEEQIQELAQDPLIHRKLVNSIAPSIYGLTDIKEAVCLLLFGGVPKVLPDGVKIRGDSNILLVGDPGTAKSIYGAELIYVGNQEKSHVRWTTEPIGSFVDKLMVDFSDDIIENSQTEILSLPESVSIFTQAMDPFSLKIRKSQVYEVSRHQTSKLVRIQTRSGRIVIATPDHSFTTILNGRLEVMTANELKPGTYLPVARKTNLESDNSVNDFSIEFPNDERISTEIITNQIEQVKTGGISARAAAVRSNITPNTMGAIIHGQISLPEGSWLRRKHDNSWFPKTIKLGEPIGRIIGFYLAEGNVERNTIRFSNLDKFINSTLENDLESTFGKASPFKEGVFLCQSSLAKWFQKRFGSGAREKRLPTELLNSPHSFKCALLSGYFCGNGTISTHSTTVSATTASRHLAYQISDLLATIGVFATIKEKTITKGPYRESVYYQIRIQSEDILQFNKHISLISKSKQKALEDLIATLHKRRRYQLKDIVPNFGRLLNDAYKELGIQGRRGTWTRGFLGELRGKTHRQRVGRKYLQKVVSTLSTFNSIQSPTLTWLQTLAHSDIFWDPITNIEEINQVTTVYDIATSDGHFVLAQGNLIAHNSQLLKYVAQIAPRGLYTSGKGSTAAGLTAAVLRDPDTEGFVLEAGALVLADRGLAAIDEFDKMRPQDRTAIHETMEQHTVSIAKAGIVATLNARAAILAAANPNLGRYVPERSFAENVNLPVTLLSRFDLIFTLTDLPETERDERTADHIIQLHQQKGAAKDPPIPADLLRKYIAYARRSITPELTDEALNVVKDFYLGMRKSGELENAPVPITARQLESLIRLAEAHAKMALRDKVLAEDAQAAVRLVQVTLLQVGFDRETGQYDIDNIMIGRAKSQRDRLQTILAMIRELEKETPGGVAIEKLIERAQLDGVSEDFVRQAIIQLRDKDGLVFEPRPGKLKYIKGA
jgi:replicative DNA helicase Mcm